MSSSANVRSANDRVRIRYISNYLFLFIYLYSDKVISDNRRRNRQQPLFQYFSPPTSHLYISIFFPPTSHIYISLASRRNQQQQRTAAHSPLVHPSIHWSFTHTHYTLLSYMYHVISTYFNRHLSFIFRFTYLPLIFRRLSTNWKDQRDSHYNHKKLSRNVLKS
jgi:hypothetical protein